MHVTSYYVVFESKELHVYTATRTDLKNSVEGKISTGMRSTVQHHLFILKHINRKSYINKQTKAPHCISSKDTYISKEKRDLH